MTKTVIILHNFLRGDRKFSNNRYFDENLLNRDDLQDNNAFINYTQAGSNIYTSMQNNHERILWNTLIHPRDQFHGNKEWLQELTMTKLCTEKK